MTLMLATNVIENAFAPLISLFQAILVFIHTNILSVSWGLSIIGLTVVVRAVMLPLTFKQYHSMQRLQQLAPQMKALQAKYKNDKQRQQQELMKFYQENKVNPFSSCLPLVLQLPVFVSLYYMLRSDLKGHICGHNMVTEYLAHHAGSHVHTFAQLPSEFVANTTCGQVGHPAKFLFIPDLTDHATGIVLIVLLVLYVGSQLGSTLLMSAATDKNQRRLMMFMPVVFVLFIFKFPTGLLVYWITTNLWTVAQQYFIRRRVRQPPQASAGVDVSASDAMTAAANGSGPSGGGKGRSRKLEPALAAGRASAPPPPPRKKKKRSGRRR